MFTAWVSFSFLQIPETLFTLFHSVDVVICLCRKEATSHKMSERKPLQNIEMSDKLWKFSVKWVATLLVGIYLLYSQILAFLSYLWSIYKA